MKNILTRRYSIILMSVIFYLLSTSQTADQTDKFLVYTFDIREQIAKPIWRITQLAFEEATEMEADLVIIHMNTYGGLVDMADSIRTKILNSAIPVYVFIDDNAASAGALISIACDSIYMRPGAKIGAATVVNQTGEQVPDKFQSYMRATMRATAEAQGKDTIITDNDTIIKWRRDPRIAEAMVDPSIFVPEVSDTGKVLTFTAEEAIQYGFCEGTAASIEDILSQNNIVDYELKEFEKSELDKIIGFLLSPIIQSLLIMFIIGGLYFELQSPGIGFPLGIAVLGAILYFAPLYLEGMVQNWEILLFILGVILLAVEIFAIPGFGVAGATGLVAIVVGLTMALVDNVVFETEDMATVLNIILRAFSVVLVSILISLILSILIGKRIFSSTTGFFANFALQDTQQITNGFISFDSKSKTLIGKEGITYTVLRPSGMVEIENEIYDAKAEYGYIEKGQRVMVVRQESGQIYVERIES